MHPTYGPGDPPAAFRREPQPPRRNRPVRPPETLRAEALRGKIRRVDRRLVAVNAGCFLALVLLSAAAPGLLATSVFGQINLGLLLCIGLGMLTLATSVAYDRGLARDCDPEAEAIRLSAEERAEAAASTDAWSPHLPPQPHWSAQPQSQPYQPQSPSFADRDFPDRDFRDPDFPQQWGTQQARTQQWGSEPGRSEW